MRGPSAAVAGLLLALVVPTAWAQEVVRGTVIDATTGNGIAGARVNSQRGVR
jgi:hypothetical protein